MSSMDAETVERKEQIWFELECLVEVPDGVDPEQVESDLRFWMASFSTDEKTTLIFDSWLKPNFGAAAV